jgi:hypothetical protein
MLDLRAAESRANREAQRWSRGQAGLGDLGGGIDLLDLAVEGLGELLGAVDIF